MNKQFTDKNLFFRILILFLIGIFFSESSPAQNLSTVKTVVIDAGHGGKDPGAVLGTTFEKDIVLNIALKLGNYIEEHLQNVKVIYTRNTDEFIELHERSAIANRNNADLFISIHADAGAPASVNGTSTFVMGLHKAAENLEVAKRENSVILKEDNYKQNYQGFDPNSPEYEIIFSLYQNAYLKQSIRFADMVQKQFKNRAMRHDRGVRQAGLVVLWNCTMPGVLIETGFLSNDGERAFLKSDYGQSIIASAIFRAVRGYFGDEYRKTGKMAENSSETKTQTNNHIKKADPVETKPESKIIFKVQIASSPNKIENKASNFKGLQNIEREYLNNRYKYYAGSSGSYSEILQLQKSAREKYPDAFVVAVKNNQRIPLGQALAESKQQ
jgi:N-acetylmuramoyl-L-alanine amidase